jgi:hypothetical protein
MLSALPASIETGPAIRFTDASNYLMVSPNLANSALDVRLTVAGTPTTLASVLVNFKLNQWYTLRLGATSVGQWAAWYCMGLVGDMVPIGDGFNSSLASGTLSSGYAGLVDYNSGSSPVTRSFDNFSAWTPNPQNVTAASGAVILDHESIARSDGTRPPEFTGSYLKCPPAGREDRTHRLAVKLRRNDIDTLPDANISDGQRVDVTAIPRVALL